MLLDNRFAVGIVGLFLLFMGIMLLKTWRTSVQGIVEKSLSKRLGLRAMETFIWFVGAFTYNFLAVISLIFGCLILFAFVTGRDWPLHYARWGDLWPF